MLIFSEFEAQIHSVLPLQVCILLFLISQLLTLIKGDSLREALKFLHLDGSVVYLESCDEEELVIPRFVLLF
jgi:hypothetical protein